MIEPRTETRFTRSRVFLQHKQHCSFLQHLNEVHPTEDVETNESKLEISSRCKHNLQEGRRTCSETDTDTCGLDSLQTKNTTKPKQQVPDQTLLVKQQSLDFTNVTDIQSKT